MNDIGGFLSKSDWEDVVSEITARHDFDAAVAAMLYKWHREVPVDAKEIWGRWLNVLRGQRKHIAHCAYVAPNTSGSGLRVLVSDSQPLFWKKLLASDFGNRIHNWLNNGESIHAPLPKDLAIRGSREQTLVFCPCGSNVQRGLIAVSTPNALISHVDSITALIAGLSEAMILTLEAASAEERGRRESAARMVHMSAADVLVVQMRLRKLAQLNDLPAEVSGEIKAALSDAESALAGFDRGFLIGSAWSEWSKAVPIYEALQQLGERLNDSIGREVISQQDLEVCKVLGRKANWQVKASRERLDYVLRDLALAPWCLSSNNPTRLRMSNGGPNLDLTFSNDATRLPARLLKSPGRLEEYLCDPSEFMFSPTGMEKAQARGVTFQLPRDLVREMHGKFTVRILPKTRLEVKISLPLAGKHG